MQQATVKSDPAQLLTINLTNFCQQARTTNHRQTDRQTDRQTSHVFSLLAMLGSPFENETRNWSKHLITDGCAKRQLGSEIAEISQLIA